MLDLFPSREAGRFGRRLKRARGARIPVTVVTGFLGAGKTTLVRRFLATPEGAGTAVVINEFGSVGIDDALVRGSSDEVTLLGNGCLCCNTRSDLQNALRNLVAERAQGNVPQFAAHPDRNQRARRSRPDPADLRHRPRPGRRISCRGGGHRGRRRHRARHAGLVGGGAQAGHPRRPAGDLEDRSRQAAKRRAPDRAPARAQSARHRSHRGRRRARPALPHRERCGRGRPLAATCRLRGRSRAQRRHR